MLQSKSRHKGTHTIWSNIIDHTRKFHISLTVVSLEVLGLSWTIAMWSRPALFVAIQWHRTEFKAELRAQAEADYLPISRRVLHAICDPRGAIVAMCYSLFYGVADAPKETQAFAAEKSSLAGLLVGVPALSGSSAAASTLPQVLYDCQQALQGVG